MDPKETNPTVGGSPGSVGQTTLTSFISSKSLLPTTSTLTKGPPPSNKDVPKIHSRNCNGTVVLTSAPNNEAELQLYRVMQRASLLAYYDTLLEMGGDDVQQLCDAGEEEFLEIMALVGMASKPLHVRRLQKALQEWVTSPEDLTNITMFNSSVKGLFRTPLSANSSANSNCITHVANIQPSNAAGISVLNFPISSSPSCIPPVKEVTPTLSPDANQVVAEHTERRDTLPRVPSPNPGSGPQVPVSYQNPILVESQISKLTESAEALVKTLPQFEPKPHNTKKKICRNLENVMKMSKDDPRRMDEIRKYSAIYGRFDCKRNPQKPLTLHEVSVNEAAAQICRFAPALLTRRDDLFSLARQVVRDSGYHFTKVQSSIAGSPRSNYHHWNTRSMDGNQSSKRAKFDVSDGVDIGKLKRQDRLEQIAEELRILGEKTEELVQAAQQVRQTNDLSSAQSLQQQMESVQSKQTKLLVEQSELLKQPLPSRFYRQNGHRISTNPPDSDKNDTDDADSQFSLSNASSPSQVGETMGQEVGDSRDSLLRDGENSSANGNAASSVRSPCKSSKQYTESVAEALSGTNGTVCHSVVASVQIIRQVRKMHALTVLESSDAQVVSSRPDTAVLTTEHTQAKIG